MKRGAVLWINLEPASPPEFGKVRPAVVISNSEQNLILPSIVVLPLSSRGEEIWPLRIALTIPELKRSFAVLPGIRQISKERIEETIGFLSLKDTSRLNEALQVYLSD